MKIFPVLLTMVAALLVEVAAAQEAVTIPSVVVVGKDTVRNFQMGKVFIFPVQQFKNHRQEEKYRRLIYNLKKVYPYAIMARNTLMAMEAEVSQIKDKRQREQYIKDAEKRLRAEFEEPLKKLTISQGRLLLKLVDRETGRTTYSIVKELRGSFQAFFWQSLARLFGSNLKSTFDADGEDKYLNRLIILYENGQLYDSY